MFQQIMKQDICKDTENNVLTSNSQSHSAKNKSRETIFAPLILVDKDVFDFNKGFDKVPNDIFLNKLLKNILDHITVYVAADDKNLGGLANTYDKMRLQPKLGLREAKKTWMWPLTI
ncbi:hypothetical protein E2320_012806, partial [Naja naja]